MLDKRHHISYHSPSGCVPLSLPHHPEGPGAQLLSQQQLTVLDQTGQSPAVALLSQATSVPRLPPVQTSTTWSLCVSLKMKKDGYYWPSCSIPFKRNIFDFTACFGPFASLAVILFCSVSEHPIIFFVLERQKKWLKSTWISNFQFYLHKW